MKTDSTKPSAPQPGADNYLFNLPPHLNNFLLECAKVATEGGEIHPFFRNAKPARAGKASAKGKEASNVNGTV